MVGLCNYMELWLSRSIAFSGCIGCRNFVDIVYNYPVCTIKTLAKSNSSKFKINEGALNMGIHYDYKSTRGDKAMKK